MMIGAGVVALIQFIVLLNRTRDKREAKKAEMAKAAPKVELTRDDADVKKAFAMGGALYLGGALILAFVSGVVTDMSALQIAMFVIFAALAALVSEIIVGIAAMHSGWFPAFAVTLILLIIGMIIGFPPAALAVLTGYVAATGPAFADMGYDLKTGHLIRNHLTREQELFGRRQQLKSGLIGFVVAIGVVAIAHQSYFEQNLLPPVDFVFATTIESGLTGEVGRQLLIWAIPGAILQAIGGTARQIGIMAATGLLILNPLAGWAVLVGIIIRLIITAWKGQEAENTMYTVAAGFIAGDAIYSFASSLWKVR